MIEFCTKRRMILAVGGLFVVSIVVLFVENHLSSSREHNETASTPLKGNATYKCWEVAEKVTVIKECARCTGFEQKSTDGCKETGYSEWVSCSLKDGVNSELRRSCPKLSQVEEQHFWLFETIVAVIGLGSYSIVHLRQKRLDRMLIEKVNRQIANGV